MAAMGFRAFLVMDNTIARQAMAGNGRKWQKMVENGLPRLFGRKWIFALFCTMVIEVARKTMAEMAENGRKWVAAVIW